MLKNYKTKDTYPEIREKAQYRVDHLIKPVGSLGKMEALYVKLCEISGDIQPDISQKSIVVFAADHGVFEEGVAATERDVTWIQAINMTKGLTGVCAFAKCAGADVRVVDLGIDADIDCEAIVHRKIRKGSSNLAKGPAMSRAEALQALQVGIDMAHAEAARGIKVLGTGEMGIGNTTPSAAILSVMTGHSVEYCTGIGANLPSAKLPLKIKVIETAIEINRPDSKDPIDVLAKLGGFDIAGMAGLILGAAQVGVPVVVDGFIATVSAVVATAIEPRAKDFIITSHHSKERGARIALEHLGLGSYLDLDLRLGEGTGAAIMFSVLDHAVAMSRYMITFDEAGFVAP